MSSALIIYYYLLNFNLTAYLDLSPQKRQLVDFMDSTDGSKINWRMMETVVLNVQHLDHLVDYHDGGEYAEGRTVACLHTLNFTNNMHLVKHL